MATGNYLGTKSEQDLYRKEEEIEKHEVEHVPTKEIEEVEHILIEKGYSKEDANKLVGLITKNEQYWIDFMMHEEMGLFAPDSASPIQKGIVTFFSFSIAGFIPLIPYIVTPQYATFGLTSVIIAIELFLFGALRSLFTGRNWFYSGCEILFFGGLAAVLAYITGFALRSISVVL